LYLQYILYLIKNNHFVQCSSSICHSQSAGERLQTQ